MTRAKPARAEELRRHRETFLYAREHGLTLREAEKAIDEGPHGRQNRPKRTLKLLGMFGKAELTRPICWSRRIRIGHERVPKSQVPSGHIRSRRKVMTTTRRPRRPAGLGSSMDTLTPNQRSECMSRVRARDTKPEMVVRRLVHRMGYRYRLHQRHLPGVPELASADVV